MPGMDRPLTRTEIAHVLHGIHDTPTVPSSITATALSATTASLELWCNLDDVELAKAQLFTASGHATLKQYIV